MRIGETVTVGGIRYRYTGDAEDRYGRVAYVLRRVFDGSEWYTYRLRFFPRLYRIPDLDNAHLDIAPEALTYWRN